MHRPYQPTYKGEIIYLKYYYDYRGEDNDFYNLAGEREGLG